LRILAVFCKRLAALLIKKSVIAAYEAEMNMVIHSLGGTFEVTIDSEGLQMVARDRGPGIADIEQAMQEGFSTASESIRRMGFGAGMGLPNIKRCVDCLEITSRVGKGTVVKMVVNFQGGWDNEDKTGD